MAQSNSTSEHYLKPEMVDSNHTTSRLDEEVQIVDTLSKISIVKKLYYKKEDSTVNIIVLHSSPNISHAIDIIEDQVIHVEAHLPDIYIDSRITHESKINLLDISKYKLVFKRN